MVRVHYLMTNAADFERCWPAMGKAFGDVRPAATMMVVGLADPRMKIEIEVTALVARRRRKRRRAKSQGRKRKKYQDRRRPPESHVRHARQEIDVHRLREVRRLLPGP